MAGFCVVDTSHKTIKCCRFWRLSWRRSVSVTVSSFLLLNIKFTLMYITSYLHSSSIFLRDVEFPFMSLYLNHLSEVTGKSKVFILYKISQRLEAAQMKFLRHLLGITKLDKEKNQCIRQKTGAQNTVKEIKQYQKNWLHHVQRMDTNRLPKQALQYKPKGRRNIGRPRKRWRDQIHLEDQGTENTPNPSGTWWWWWLTVLITNILLHEGYILWK